MNYYNLWHNLLIVYNIDVTDTHDGTIRLNEVNTS